MKKKLILCLLCMGAFAALYAQGVVVQGKVRNKQTGEPLPAASVQLKGSTSGTATDETGSFRLSVASLPALLLITSTGFEAQEISVHAADAGILLLEPVYALGQDVVLSATRVPTRILESPVSVERFGLMQIRNAPATSYYDLAGYLKGIDLTTPSLTFKTISTRGFNGSGSSRVNQIVDGMDNQAPGLNFLVGNFAGLTELDVESVEVLPGASSALYGPGGMNGTVLIQSKNPFRHQGLSVQLKEGIMHVDGRQRNASPYHDFSMRWAKAFNNRWAFKIGAQYISANDWLAADSSNYSRAGNVGKVIAGNRRTDPNYDGVNVYGDETSINIYGVAEAMVAGGFLPAQALPLIPNTAVSRTGYDERDVINPKTKNLKLSGALHYKFSENLEAQLMGYWAKGNTVYTGNNRYVLKDIRIGQYKLELRHPRWFIRTYTTQENAGDAYSATIATQLFNEAWKRSELWFPQYVGAYATGAGQIVQQVLGSGGDMQQALAAVQNAGPLLHGAARSFADQGRPAAGSVQFRQLFDSVRKVPIPRGGLFLEKSQLWMTEGQYTLPSKIVDVVVGGNWKQYVLDSDGTLFIDTAGAIKFTEIGAYVQATRKLFNNVLTLSASGRYDKNEDFKGRFTPRVTALIKLAKDNNLRLSYQTAYRFPTTQQKYIRLDVGDYTLLGGLPWVEDYLGIKSGDVVELINGVPDTKPYQYRELKPESMRSYEIGYKGLIGNKLLIDVYGYWGRYQDFLGRNALLKASTGKIFSTVVNSSTKVSTHGFGLGLDYRLPKNFSTFLNFYSDVIKDVPTGFQAYFNTPKYRLNAGIANSGLGKKERIGFNVMFRWQDAFAWDGELANGPVNAYSTVDAQVNYRIPKIKTMIKIGGTNIFNQYYKNAYGNPEIGGVYYVSIGFNL